VTDAADTVAQFRRAVELLAEIDDLAANMVAEAIATWLGGVDFDTAAGLPSDWRIRERVAMRDRALRELLGFNPGMNARAVARRILADLPGCGRQKIRPDGAAGHVHDLAALGLDLSERHLRRLITDLRGHQETCNGHDDRTGSRPGGNDAKETDHD
jgi:hypothetical protein